MEETDEYEVILNSRAAKGKALLDQFDYSNAKKIFTEIIEGIKDTQVYYLQLNEAQEGLSLCE